MKKFILATLSFVMLGLISCDKEDPKEIPHEHELITTLKYTLISQNNNDTIVMEFEDLDGEGGNSPIINVSKDLKLNEVYTGTLVLLNESEDHDDHNDDDHNDEGEEHRENIAEEVKEEAEEHQVFFNGGELVKVEYTDRDKNNNPLGLETKLTALKAGSGTLKITLKHEPNKDASKVSEGDITNAGGETDIEVTFKINVI